MDTLVKLAQTCVFCRKTYTITVAQSAIDSWNRGAFVQDAFPELDASDRELFFMSNICETCFDLLGDDED